MEIDVKIKKNNGEIETVKYSPHEKTGEKRIERISMKVLPSVKAAAEKRAAEEGRTLSNYIEHLIKEDVKRSKDVDIMDFIK